MKYTFHCKLCSVRTGRKTPPIVKTDPEEVKRNKELESSFPIRYRVFTRYILCPICKGRNWIRTKEVLNEV